MSPKIQPGTSAYRRFALAMLMAGLAAFAIFYCVQPLLPLLGACFGVKAEEASLVISLTIGPMAIALPFAGFLSDRIGRRRLMSMSLFAAALSTIACAFAQSWHLLLGLRLLAGLLLAGVPAVAMTYIAEEVEDAAVGGAIGQYIAGTAMGGMLGRLSGGIIADMGGWREAIGVIGVLVLTQAFLFRHLTRGHAHFAPVRSPIGDFFRRAKGLFGDRALPWLFAEALLLMGAFVTLYNYIGYRLLAPPYNLSQSLVGAIFILFVVGSASSAWAGRMTDRIGPERTLPIFLCLFLAGAILSLAGDLMLVVAAIAIITAGFFGAHSTASSWVSRRAGEARTQAAACYLCFYYLGGSILGSAGGFAWSTHGWAGVVAYSAALLTAAAAIGLALLAATPE